MFSRNEQREILNSDHDDLFQIVMRMLAEVGLQVEDLSAQSGKGGQLRVTTPTGMTQLYEVDTKSRVSLATAVAPPTSKRGKVLVAAPYIPEPVAEYWRQQNVHFVDSVGNMHVRLEGLAADIRGRRKPASPIGDRDKPLRVFKTSGLKILFVLLAHPDMVDAGYREVARASGSSLGSVQWAFKELEEIGHISWADQNRGLHRTRDLLDRWVNAYTLDLGRKLTLARFDAPDPRWWTEANDALRAEEAQWGGETAVHLLNRRLLPSRAVLYASTVPVRIAGKFRLRKAKDDGNVEIRERFWRFDDASGSVTVPTPLIYADLVASADPRQLEAAAYLREHDELLRRLDRS